MVLKMATPWGVTCREFEEFIVDYFENELDSRARRVFEWHLRFCPECRAYMTAYKLSMDLTREVFRGDPDDPVPEEVPEDLVRAILEARRAQSGEGD